MSANPIEHLFTLQRSPIALAPVIHNFFAHSKPRERDLLLSYLVLPMVLYPAMQEYLLTVRKTSNLRTLQRAETSGRTHLQHPAIQITDKRCPACAPGRAEHRAHR